MYGLYVQPCRAARLCDVAILKRQSTNSTPKDEFTLHREYNTASNSTFIMPSINLKELFTVGENNPS